MPATSASRLIVPRYVASRRNGWVQSSATQARTETFRSLGTGHQCQPALKPGRLPAAASKPKPFRLG